MLADTYNDYIGIYVREPSILSLKEQFFIDGIYYILHEHTNVIIPGRNNTNWSKHLHVEKIFLAISDNDQLRVPSTSSGICIDKIFASEVIKPCSNIKGIAKKRKLAEEYNYLIEKLKIPYISQEEIIGEEIRVHMLDNSYTAINLKHPRDDYSYKNNTFCICKTVKVPTTITQSLYQILKNEGSRFCGFDLIKDSHNIYWILEINPMPGFHSYDLALYDKSFPTSNMITSVLYK